ncbi:MAG TPA: hypothetical protein VFW50_43775 [Streptosporangiaceae bacterium]|nr:hypothetical protein [Streptosporangiaceae bacterium]
MANLRAGLDAGDDAAMGVSGLFRARYPLSRNDFLVRQDPPIREIVPVTIRTAGGQVEKVYVWFARTKGGQGTMLCSQIFRKQTVTAAICQSVQLSAGQVAVLTGGDSVIKLGAASSQVTSVSAQLSGGAQRSREADLRPRLPGQGLAVELSAPGQGRDGRRRGNRLPRRRRGPGRALDRPRREPVPAGRTCGMTVFRNQRGSATAYLARGRVEVSSTGLPPAVFESQPASGPPDVSAFTSQDDNPPTWLEFYGYAHENVARVTVQLADGRQVAATTFPGWKGSGIRLWAVPAPVPAPRPLRYIVLGYDAGGHVVWQTTFGEGSAG